MSDVSVQHARRARSSGRVRRVVAVAVAVFVVLVMAVLYLRIGWWKMESACSLDNASGQIHSRVSYGWSWHPLGFQCTYDHGKTTETSLWF